jgi:hypothetical protein
MVSPGIRCARAMAGRPGLCEYPVHGTLHWNEPPVAPVPPNSGAERAVADGAERPLLDKPLSSGNMRHGRPTKRVNISNVCFQRANQYQ